MKIFPFDLKEETEMKFSEMPYKRPDLKAMKKEIAGLIPLTRGTLFMTASKNTSTKKCPNFRKICRNLRSPS